MCVVISSQAESQVRIQSVCLLKNAKDVSWWIKNLCKITHLQPQPMSALATPQPKVPAPRSKTRSSFSTGHPGL